MPIGIQVSVIAQRVRVFELVVLVGYRTTEPSSDVHRAERTRSLANCVPGPTRQSAKQVFSPATTPNAVALCAESQLLREQLAMAHERVSPQT